MQLDEIDGNPVVVAGVGGLVCVVLMVSHDGRLGVSRARRR